MTAKRKGLLALLVVWALFLALSSWDSDVLPVTRDITQVKLIRTLALDQGEGAALRLTACGDLRKQGNDGQSQPPLILTQEAQTISGGCSGLQQQSDGYVEFGHLAECVVGEELARKELLTLADFVARDFSMRMESKLFVVAGATGEEAVKGTASQSSALTDRLTAISQNRSLGGRKWPYTFRQLISQLEDNGCGLVPVLTLTDNPDYDPEGKGEEPEKEINLTGLAFLKENKLSDFLTPEESVGAALLTNQNQLDMVELTLEDGSSVGVQLVYAQRSLEPVFDEEGRLTELTLRIKAKGELSEISGPVSPTDERALEEMRQAFLEQLKSWAQAALDRSQKEGADFLHLRRELICSKPMHSRQLQEN
ncbi:MAG: Ger(x)C family spore germination C-terminal domain-containing protein, partial [Candidatus Onthomonas sp.]